MAKTVTDSRHVIKRGSRLEQLSSKTHYDSTADAKQASVSELDNMLDSINAETTPPLRLDASDIPDLTVSIGNSIVSNPETGRQKSIPHVGSIIPAFTSGTVVFPASSGGNMVVTPGTDIPLTVASNEYVKVLLALNSAGEITVVQGASDAVEANALVPPAPANTLAIGYVSLFNNAGTIDNIVQTKIFQFGTGSGGSGTGSGLGDDINTLKFQASFNEEFTDAEAINTTAGFTDDTLRSAANALYRLNYDADKTVTTTGTSAVMSAAPAFTIKAGDVIISGGIVRKISSLSDQQNYTLEAAFPSDLAAATCNISQAVHTVDLNAFNDSGDGLAIGDVYSGTFSTFMISYRDSEALGDIIFDEGATALIAASASSDSASWSSAFTRNASLNSENPIRNLPSTGSELKIRFFANKTSGTGAVNLLDYKAYLHQENIFQVGDNLDQAYCLTDGSGIEINCAVSSDTGKTRITTTFGYGVGVESGKTNGQLDVYLDGKKIPRFIDSILTPDASYLEIEENVIELDADYSGVALSVEIKKPIAIIDTTTDNVSNIASLQNLQECGFNNFVKKALIDVPNTQIVNRAQIIDPSNNLKAGMGIDRIAIQEKFTILDESGLGGQLVQRVANDSLDRVRLVGDWINTNNPDGKFVHTTSTSSNDYIEVTFYGTGLNLLTFYPGGATLDLEKSIDGAPGVAINLTNLSSVLSTRNYNPNQILPIASGLSLGLHTIRVHRTGGLINFHVSGAEILNEATQINIKPGTSFISGKKLTSSVLQNIDYNTGFESGTLGTKGGRVLVYQKGDGTIAKAVTPTDIAQGNLVGADHSNEEVIRTYNFREFGANRADDFSTLVDVGSNRAFTLDDGSTTLVGNGVRTSSGLAVETETFGSFITLNFVGTGLSIVRRDNTGGSGDTHSVTVDGVFTGNVESNGSTNERIEKIVSGLPYGTHTVKFQSVAQVVYRLGIKEFIVYGPKKPSLPANAMEIADYNIIADFVANTVGGVNTISTGTIRKDTLREVTAIGTGWNVGGIDLNNLINGTDIETLAATGSMKFVFFGTGFDFRFATSASRSSNITVRLNGVDFNTANFPTEAAAATVYGTGATFTPATAILDQNNVSTIPGGGFVVSGLPLAYYELEFVGNTNGLSGDALDIITPIHSPKSNSPANFQNALPIGSSSISDNRAFSPVQDTLSEATNWAKAVGVVVNPTTTAIPGSQVPLPDMQAVVKITKDNARMRIMFTCEHRNSLGTAAVDYFYIYVDGVQVSGQYADLSNGGGAHATFNFTDVIPVSKGTHHVQIFWAVSSGTMTALETDRILTIEEEI